VACRAAWLTRRHSPAFGAPSHVDPGFAYALVYARVLGGARAEHPVLGIFGPHRETGRASAHPVNLAVPGVGAAALDSEAKNLRTG
jgi:hypothetical protein